MLKRITGIKGISRSIEAIGPTEGERVFRNKCRTACIVINTDIRIGIDPYDAAWAVIAPTHPGLIYNNVVHNVHV